MFGQECKNPDRTVSVPYSYIQQLHCCYHLPDSLTPRRGMKVEGVQDPPVLLLESLDPMTCSLFNFRKILRSVIWIV